MEIYTSDVLNVLYAYGVFVLVYIANILFSLYLNIEVFNEAFDKYKIGRAIKKALVLVVATLMLVIAIDTVLLYFNSYVPELTEGQRQATVTVATIIVTIGRAALKYLIEGIALLRKILEVKPDADQADSTMYSIVVTIITSAATGLIGYGFLCCKRIKK